MSYLFDDVHQQSGNTTASSSSAHDHEGSSEGAAGYSRKRRWIETTIGHPAVDNSVTHSPHSSSIAAEGSSSSGSGMPPAACAVEGSQSLATSTAEAPQSPAEHILHFVAQDDIDELMAPTQEWTIPPNTPDAN